MHELICLASAPFQHFTFAVAFLLDPESFRRLTPQYTSIIPLGIFCNAGLAVMNYFAEYGGIS